jgi:hypothetical protein
MYSSIFAPRDPPPTLNQKRTPKRNIYIKQHQKPPQMTQTNKQTIDVIAEEIPTRLTQKELTLLKATTTNAWITETPFLYSHHHKLHQMLLTKGYKPYTKIDWSIDEQKEIYWIKIE